MSDSIDPYLDAQITRQYREHRQFYDATQRKLDAVREAILEAPDLVAKTVLFLADMYAIISSNTRVRAHELGFLRAVEASTDKELREALANTRAILGSGDWAVMYHPTKAEHIIETMNEVDYDRHLRLFREGEFDRLHRLKVDGTLDDHTPVKGLGTAKAAFSLAMCGVTQKMCVDSNVARFFGLDPDEDVPSSKVVPPTYEAFCADLRARAPTIIREDGVSNYIWQWVTFDFQRAQGVETHDPWFLTVEDTVDEPILTR